MPVERPQSGIAVWLIRTLEQTPGRLVALVAVTQITLWALLPTLIFPTVPYDTAEGFLWGRSFELGYHKHPPLQAWILGVSERLCPGAFWLSCVYAQVCVAITFWAVWQLSRAIVGDRQGALATIGLAGVHTYSLPTATFTPDLLLIATWALLGLHYWRAVGEGRTLYWYAVALDVALICYSKYVGLLLLLVLIILTLATTEGRRALPSRHPWLATLVALGLTAPHLWWIASSEGATLTYPLHRQAAQSIGERGFFAANFVGAQALNHIGLGLMVWIVWGGRPELVVDRAPVSRFARSFVFAVSVVPIVIVLILNLASGVDFRHAWAMPMFCWSPLALVVLAGGHLNLRRLGAAVALFAALVVLSPIVSVGFRVVRIAQGGAGQNFYPAAMFADMVTRRFQERTGKPLRIVVGQRYEAGQLAHYSAARPLML